jgi:O-antigen/teichoic acid export membrane protein
MPSRHKGRPVARRPFVGTLSVNVVLLALGTITGVIAARGLQVDDRGLLFSIVVWSSMAGWIAVAGQQEAIVYGAGGSAIAAEEIRGGGARADYRRAVPFSALLVIVNGYLLWGQDLIVIAAGAAAATSPLLVVFGQMRIAVLRAAQRWWLWNCVRLVGPFVYAGLLGALFLFETLSLEGGLLAFLVSQAASAASANWAHRVVVPDRGNVLYPSTRPRRFHLYGRQVLLADLPYLANQRLDQMVISLLASPRDAGLYAVAVAFAGPLQQVGSTIESILFPRLVAKRSSGETASFGRTMLVACTASICIAALLWLSAIPLVQYVFGVDYTDAAQPGAILAVGGVFTTASAFLTASSKARGAVRHVFWGHICGAGSTLVLLLVLTPSLGAVGAAISSLGGFGVTTVTLSVLHIGGRHPLSSRRLDRP